MWLADGPDTAYAAKAATLAALAAAGLPVPRGVVIPLEAARSPTILAAFAELLASGPVIVRSALQGEDSGHSSGAGLGLSVGDVGDARGIIAALDRIAAHRSERWLKAYRDRTAAENLAQRSDQAIVQHQVDARALVVGALLRGLDLVEVHIDRKDALESGATPGYSGLLEAWPDPARAELAALFGRLRNVAPPARHGLDVEIAIDHDGAAHVVQLRPFTRPFDPDSEAFVAEVEHLGQTDGLECATWTLDAEHNSAPLSPAHAWLIELVSEQRPHAGVQKVFAGWLYVQTLVRDLDGSAQTPLGPHAVLERLCSEFVPAARGRLERIEAELRTANGEKVADTLGMAVQGFLAMVDDYLEVLIPARVAARKHATYAPPSDSALSLVGRAAFTDVLPASWDIASPTLAELGADSERWTPATMRELIPQAASAAAALVGEWDDHLFALGLAGVRRVYLRAAQLLGLGHAVFLVRGDELEAQLRGAAPSAGQLATRRAEQRRFAALRPPPTISRGRPLRPLPGQRLRGIGIGPDYTGLVAQRCDLEAVLTDPPDPKAVLIVPALTAQAAVALHALGIVAVCCEYGGALSHAALMARELGLSALIGCSGCCDVPAGSKVRLATARGRLEIVSDDVLGQS